jgi:hypothetical protein
VALVFPELRERLDEAVTELCDEELQDRLWRRGERRNDRELGFDDAMLLVIDELDWPESSELVGSVSRNNAELAAFRRLSSALNDLVDVIGNRGTDVDAVASGAPWREVLAAARSLGRVLHE